MNICVHTFPGWRGETEPHVFFVGSRRLLVAGIVDRWTQHPLRYFEVVCEDGRRFLLCHDTDRRTWELAGVYASTSPRRPAVVRAAPQLRAVQWLMSRSPFFRKQKPIV
jgi:hypothetical protein